ncbi:hypothetical protein MRB53_030986 [Persea americana]|uniref:Uncharacterized protein n=1 Tax=Persea americana TaxID=3435 RepID=A0ACC2KNQ9_PERAE|nr:hypothetical protein MRB53_030986 [Persea americana]
MEKVVQTLLLMPTYADFLRTKCHNPPDPETTLFMDPGSFFSFHPPITMKISIKTKVSSNQMQCFSPMLVPPPSAASRT